MESKAFVSCFSRACCADCSSRVKWLEALSALGSADGWPDCSASKKPTNPIASSTRHSINPVLVGRTTRYSSRLLLCLWIGVPGLQSNFPGAFALAFEDQDDFSFVLEGLLWRGEIDFLTIDAPLIREVTVNLNVLPVHGAINHLRACQLRRKAVQPLGNFRLSDHRCHSREQVRAVFCPKSRSRRMVHPLAGLDKFLIECIQRFTCIMILRQ